MCSSGHGASSRCGPQSGAAQVDEGVSAVSGVLLCVRSRSSSSGTTSTSCCSAVALVCCVLRIPLRTRTLAVGTCWSLVMGLKKVERVLTFCSSDLVLLDKKSSGELRTTLTTLLTESQSTNEQLR